MTANYTIMNQRASSIEIGACRCGRAALKTSTDFKVNYRCVLWARATCVSTLILIPLAYGRTVE